MSATEKAKEKKRETPNETGRVVRQLRNRCIAPLVDQNTNQDMDEAEENHCIEEQTKFLAVIEKTKKRKRETRRAKLTLKEKISNDAPHKEYIVGEIVLATVVGVNLKPS